MKMKQELSYRERIARQLRTQYVKGRLSNTVTLKSRLWGHWRSLETAPFDIGSVFRQHIMSMGPLHAQLELVPTSGNHVVHRPPMFHPAM